ncbi:16S rRNA (cytidine(1402)-2'-O)-methyltransferase [Peptoniphilus sp.]|uniref:16S rRNA (cytidine(1402)-2'-O)-methyltransferase n=1 Tax=Peptoniphilus sp. TaxID=1971214 RepID=UPI003991BBE8
MIYFCPTPIGNLEDITIRTLNVLKSVDIICCEDTRNSIKLLNNFDIKKRLIAYHKFNERQKVDELIELSENNDIAIISDAGMPGISDPGFILIRELIDRDIEFEVLPGSTASILALLYSGFSTEHFFFYGFLDSKRSKRLKELEDLKELKFPIIFYEAPHRILETLEDLKEVFGNREISISRELTKMFEEHIRGSIEEILAKALTLKGEFVIVVDGYEEEELEIDIRAELERRVADGMKMSQAIKEVAKEFGLKKNDVYKVSLEDE